MTIENGQDKQLESATLGGGCFWCLEAIYDDLEGVFEVVSGYSGGHVSDPTYQQVCSGTTGHAEVVQISFDPRVISYRALLEIFFTIHDPTTLNRQGNDIGSQYRSVIFYHDQSQKEIAETVMEEVERQDTWKKPLVTQIMPFEVFYPAEDYHQEYYSFNTQQPYCQVVITPKIQKFRKRYVSQLKI